RNRAIGIAVMGVLLAVAVKRVSRKDVALFLFLVAAAFALADLSWQGGVKERLETLYDMGSAGETRFIIWRQSWEMLKDSPWWGRGLGLYSLAWPPYRDPADTSAGYFVHNDYLQIWIELGLPGLVLFIAVLISALWMFIRLLRNVAVPPDSKIELTGLFGGLLAVAMHSFLDFNFYIMAILMISGLMLGRIHSIAVSVEGIKGLVLRPSRVFGAKAYRAMVILLAMFPLVYFVSLGLSAYEYDKALALTGKGHLQEAGEALSRAARLSPTSDNVFMSQADLYRHLITVLSSEKQNEKILLFNQARDLLDQAEQLNPLRAQIYAVRGQLYQENPLLLGEDGFKQAIQAYQQALRLNPRLYPARLRYAKLLYSLGRREEAHRLTEEGMKHWYYETDDIVPYYAFTAKLRFEAGEKEQAIALANSIERILKDFGWRRVPVPERPMFKTT
ncbi:MAG: O-antigen ligase family protein, partial [Pseudomonadota bacterium]